MKGEQVTETKMQVIMTFIQLGKRLTMNYKLVVVPNYSFLMNADDAVVTS
jgi:hypothetical protein